MKSKEELLEKERGMDEEWKKDKKLKFWFLGKKRILPYYNIRKSSNWRN